jgi:hypothetical protein
MSRASKAFLDLGLASMTLQQERTMDALLKGFSGELETLSKLAPTLTGMMKIDEKESKLMLPSLGPPLPDRSSIRPRGHALLQVLD